jgi:hypothetical protein
MAVDPSVQNAKPINEHHHSHPRKVERVVLLFWHQEH